MDPVVIRGASREEILAAPAVLLGFHPTNSLVALFLQNSRIECCVRLDLDWFALDHARVSSQLEHALERLPEAGVVVIGYGSDQDRVIIALDALVEVLGTDRLVAEFLHRGGSYHCLCGDCEPQPFEFEATSIAAQAVYHGVRIDQDRAAALAFLDARCPAPPTDVIVASEALTELTMEESFVLMASLVERDRPLDADEALLLVLLMAEEDRQAAIFQRLLETSGRRPELADRLWQRLTEAYIVAPGPLLFDVLALVALASWLTARGAAHSACLDRLHGVNPGHPWASLAERVHREAISPAQFRGEDPASGAIS